MAGKIVPWFSGYGRELIRLANAGEALTTLGALGTISIQVFTSSGTYTPTVGMKYCIVEAVGAGGGGGGAASSAGGTFNGAGGGGAGEYARSVLAAAAIGASKAVAIGAGGSAGAAGNNNGGTGGDTTLGSTIVVASGGLGGGGAVSAAIGAAGVNGSGGTGDFLAEGDRGQQGFSATSLVLLPYNRGGNGGSSMFGRGGAGSPSVSVLPTYGGGGGGGGSYNGVAAQAGVAGKAGTMIITEFG